MARPILGHSSTKARGVGAPPGNGRRLPLLLFPAAIGPLATAPLVPVLRHPRFTLFRVPPRGAE